MVDNAFYQAPADERTSAAEASRYLRVADLAAKNHKSRTAIWALREALTVDPDCAPQVRRQIESLPLSAAARARVADEFAWNIAALAPADDTLFHDERPRCWSYRVREVRLRQERTVQTPAGMEHQLSFDARSWVFSDATGKWSADGEWLRDAGMEVELVNGPPQPRYRALAAAAHQFYADGTVPVCHHSGWTGPYDPSGTVYVAAQLPMASALAPQ